MFSHINCASATKLSSLLLHEFKHNVFPMGRANLASCAATRPSHISAWRFRVVVHPRKLEEQCCVVWWHDIVVASSRPFVVLEMMPVTVWGTSHALLRTYRAYGALRSRRRHCPAPSNDMPGKASGCTRSTQNENRSSGLRGSSIQKLGLENEDARVGSPRRPS